MDKEYFTNRCNVKIDIYRVSRGSLTTTQLISSFTPIDSTIFGIYSSKNLQSYSFSKNVNSWGDFEIQVKEDYNNDKSLLDVINHLDLVYIYEYNKLCFVGFVEKISFGATVGAYNKSIIISGRSVGALFDMMVFALDESSMEFFVIGAANNSFSDKITQLVSAKESVKNIVNEIVDFFITYITNPSYKKISSYGIFDLIKCTYGERGSAYIYCDDSLKFYYTPQCNIFKLDEISIISYLRNIFPSDIYEIYEDTNAHQLILREKPFDHDKWEKLKLTKLKPGLITDYTVTKSNENVFTSFLGYLANSPMLESGYLMGSAEVKDGKINPGHEFDDDKAAIYGFKPLKVRFTGYNSKTSDTETLTTSFKNLSKKLKNWYSKLDELYNGDVTIVKVEDVEVPVLGNRAELCGGQFYVSAEKHMWNYGNSIKVTYSLERGANYFGGTRNEIKNISKQFSELLEI